MFLCSGVISIINIIKWGKTVIISSSWMDCKCGMNNWSDVCDENHKSKNICCSSDCYNLPSHLLMFLMELEKRLGGAAFWNQLLTCSLNVIFVSFLKS